MKPMIKRAWVPPCLSLLFLLAQAGGISDHQQSWGYEDGPWKGPGPPAGGR